MKLTKHDIGGELISIITKGMYTDPKDALREYIQNGVDALAKNLIIKIKHNTIIVSDDGHGMDKVIMRKAIRVGISEKNPKKSVGFMGIGLYSSFHLCDRLTIYSKVENESPNRMIFHFENMRANLEHQKYLRLNEKSKNKPEQIDLQTLLENNIEFHNLKEASFPKVGTRVEMEGLESNFFKSLSKEVELTEYLERVIPLPFSPDFTYGNQIQKHIEAICKKHNSPFRTVNLTLEINGNEQPLFRPYRDADFRDKAHPDDKPLAPKYYELIGNDGFLGLAWGCLNSGRRNIPNPKVRGFIVKKQGFTIGKREDLVSHYGRLVYFNRYVGEFIVVHPKLLPNGPRSDFEYSMIRTTFYGILQEVATKYNRVADEYQEQEKALSDIAEAIDTYNEIQAQVEFFSSNGDKLLEFFQDLNIIQINLSKKLAADKIRKESKKDAEDIIRRIKTLLSEIKSYLEIKKSKNKKKANSLSSINKLVKPIPKKGSEPLADNLTQIIELFGLEINDDLKSIFELIDDMFIKSQSNSKEEYNKKLAELKRDIETLFETE